MRVVAGTARGRHLVSPPAATTRSATERIRESLFAIFEPRLEGAAVLDLFAGAGTLGIEALSRGAARATFVERSRPALAAIRENLRSTGFADRASVVASDVLAFLARADRGGPYDVVFCDPPFADTATLSTTLAHEGLRGALAAGAMVVVRVLAKHRPAIPEGATTVREKRIGEETLLFVRYDPRTI